jgi:hypothetical protein
MTINLDLSDSLSDSLNDLTDQINKIRHVHSSVISKFVHLTFIGVRLVVLYWEHK